MKNLFHYISRYHTNKITIHLKRPLDSQKKKNEKSIGIGHSLSGSQHVQTFRTIPEFACKRTADALQKQARAFLFQTTKIMHNDHNIWII